MSARWSVEQVESVAPSAAAVTAAQPLATPTRWSGAGADEHAVWGSCRGSGAEPYDTMVDHRHVGFACTCPSRRSPCKHALALLLLWVRGQVADTMAPPTVGSWLARRGARRGTDPSAASGGARPADQPAGGALDAGAPDTGLSDTATSDTGAPGDGVADDRPPPPEGDRDTARDDRVARMHAGLAELDRWLDDRIRTGLADPSLAQYATWDSLAARLVDAQAGSLANRIRRLAGLVGASPDWHDDVLGELGLLHLLSQAGRRLGELPDHLADAVATTVGWQVRQADVLAGVPDTDHWVVAGRSDVREDRIEVRRFWLRGATSGRWALVLSFAAYRQSLDTSLTVGTSITADLHRYPGPALRSLVGRRHDDVVGPASRPGQLPRQTVAQTVTPSMAQTMAAPSPPARTVAGACDELGTMLAAEPWLDRLPVTVRARLARVGNAWALTDDTGSLPVLDRGRSYDSGVVTLLAVSAGGAVDMTVEWTPHGVVPLTIHLADRSIDIGPRADASFVGAA